ncbi:alpha/beta hydrolase [Bacillus sp. EAC]|uniref:alpha/beta hydrolase n=1 Tax=Bacillus sp. EAC TaxID=1978338 RepID=UPI000B43ACB5|nr:alpha/beta hydrolase [Bacillus sp. EAC]
MTIKEFYAVKNHFDHKYRNSQLNQLNPYSYYPQNWNNEYTANPYESHYYPDQTDFFHRHQSQITFVLVHGSWVDPSFWNGISADLRKMGHVVHTPQLAGHGTDTNKNVTHEIVTKSVVDYITTKNLINIILVGHSFGGSVIQKVAEQLPDRIKRLVFWNAFVLNDGESMADQFPKQAQDFLLGLAQQSSDHTIKLPFSYFRETFVNLADLQTAQQIYNSTTPEPANPLVEKLDLKNFYRLTTPRSFINLQEDTVIPAGEQYGWYPHLASRLGIFRFIQGHGDHMSTAKLQPRRIAQLIVNAGRD